MSKEIKVTEESLKKAIHAAQNAQIDIVLMILRSGFTLGIEHEDILKGIESLKIKS